MRYALARLPVAVLAALVAVGAPSAALTAETQSFHGDYTVSFLGLSVAKATFKSRYENEVYSIQGSVSTAGLAQIFDDTRGTVSTSGRVLADGIQPGKFRADYTSGKKKSLIDIGFDGGRVVSTKVVPTPKRRGSDWLPLDMNDLAGVADPISATVIRADTIEKVCGRTVKLYDGEMRADLKLAFVSKGRISVKGYEGPTVTCRLAFEPVSGFAKKRKALKFLQNKSRIDVTFAPLGKTGIYAPVRATVGTQIGTITLDARRFETVD
jgi:hypothetical protein